MDSAINVSDPTDWLQTLLPTFSPLENALRCQVCKDFFDTPMITSCSHTFCSLCIRRCLSSDGKCPACRNGEQAIKLRRNWAIEEVVSSFQAARPTALKLATRVEEQDEGANGTSRPRKRQRVDRAGHEEMSSSQRQTRSKTKRASSASQADTVEIVDTDSEREATEQPEDGLVPCPMCGKRMKEEAVFAHIDRCDDEQAAQKQRGKSRPPALTNNPLQQQQAQSRPRASRTAPPAERLPELAYSLLKDNALRKKLQELGIPTFGTKQLLIRRHVEWINLWNSNCDSNRPRSKRELLQELDTWERSQGGHARDGQQGLTNSVMKKDFDAKGWQTSNKDDFSRLIAEARRKKTATPMAETDTATETQNHEAPAESASEKAEDTGKAQQPNPASEQNEQDSSRSTRPYENNPEAMASIRSKVAQANSGTQPEPLMNAGFASPEDDPYKDTAIGPARQAHTSTNSDPAPKHGADTPPSSQRPSYATAGHGYSRFGAGLGAGPGAGAHHHDDADAGHDGAREGSPCNLPEHWNTSQARKVPMFRVPEGPVLDVDGGMDGR